VASMVDSLLLSRCTGTPDQAAAMASMSIAQGRELIM
jgi:hypothetical protein